MFAVFTLMLSNVRWIGQCLNYLWFLFCRWQLCSGVKNAHQDLVKQLIKLCAETHLNAADCRQCAWVTHKNEAPLLSKAASPVEKRKEISTAGCGKWRVSIPEAWSSLSLHFSPDIWFVHACVCMNKIHLILIWFFLNYIISALSLYKAVLSQKNIIDKHPCQMSFFILQYLKSKLNVYKGRIWLICKYCVSTLCASTDSHKTNHPMCHSLSG